jgi:hypothetical protein
MFGVFFCSCFELFLALIMARAGCPPNFPFPLFGLDRSISLLHVLFLFSSFFPFLSVSGAFWTGWFCLLVYNLVRRRRPSYSQHTTLKTSLRPTRSSHLLLLLSSEKTISLCSPRKRGPESLGSLLPACFSALGIQFNLLRCAVRDFWLVNSGAAPTTVHTNATDGYLWAVCLWRLADEQATLQLSRR